MMTGELGYQYLFYGMFFIIAICFSILINFLILRFSSNLGMRDQGGGPGQVRWGLGSKPSLGGFSFYIIFLLSLSVLGVVGVDEGSFNKQLIGLMAASSLGFLIGLADDAYNTNPLIKFIGQFTCANILILTSYVIPVTESPEFNYLFTILWIIGLMNSINMLDNMDAITTTISITILMGGIVLTLLHGAHQPAYIIIMLGVAGALIGFLFFNWHPSRMYMGDTGSQFLGVFLAAISILFFWNIRTPYIGMFDLRQFLIPMLLFIIPLCDTATVVIRRLSRRQSPFVGGKDHITHHLAYLGLSDQWVAIVLGSISLASVFIVWLIFPYYENDWNIGYTLIGLGYFVAVFAVLQVLYQLGKRKQAARDRLRRIKAVKAEKI
jgi:UDP-GlcNAc:undecaprenyl-phosphate GlcNAc-1-phosphate transferase